MSRKIKEKSKKTSRRINKTKLRMGSILKTTSSLNMYKVDHGVELNISGKMWIAFSDGHKVQLQDVLRFLSLSLRYLTFSTLLS